MESLTLWITSNWIEFLGTATGILYVIFSIKQNILTWPLGILTSLLYIIVFYNSEFYAGMCLQVYYVGISIYGWYIWKKGGDQGEDLHVTTTSKKILFILILFAILLLSIIAFTLNRFNSPVIFYDSFLTSLSIIATWMLARKKIENWILWIFIDLLSAIIYFIRDLHATAFLFITYVILSFVGYKSWNIGLNVKNEVQ